MASSCRSPIPNSPTTARIIRSTTSSRWRFWPRSTPALSAWRITGDSQWQDEALRAFAWFHGENTAGLSLLDGEGGCYDGLNPNGLNLNQGAESILSYPMSWAALKAELYRSAKYGPITSQAGRESDPRFALLKLPI